MAFTVLKITGSERFGLGLRGGYFKVFITGLEVVVCIGEEGHRNSARNAMIGKKLDSYTSIQD